MKLMLENIRGFVGHHELEIKPLTILVGENSSGKTSLLGSLFSVLQTDFPNADVFNRTPFELGSFDTIATYRAGKYGRASTFSLRWEIDGDNLLEASFVNHKGIPRVQTIHARANGQSIKGRPMDGEFDILLYEDKKKFETNIKVDV